MERRRCEGYSLTELMVAGTLTTVSVLGLIELYTTNMDSARLQGAIAYTHENALVALEVLKQDIRKAGYLGFENQEAKLANYLDQSDLDSQFGIRALHYTGSPMAVPVTWSSALVNPSDVLSLTWVTNDLSSTEPFEQIEVCPNGSEQKLFFVSNDFSTPTSDCTTEATDELTDPAGDFGACRPYAAVGVKQTYLIAQGRDDDHHHLHMESDKCPPNTTQFDGQFSVCHTVSAHCVNKTEDFMDDLNQESDRSAALYDLQQIIYFVDDDHYLHRVVDGVDSKIIPDVQSLLFRFGVDTDGDQSIDEYKTSTQVNTGNEWDQVISVEFTLRLTAPSNLIYGEPFSREYSGVASIRNRAIPL